LYLWFLQVSTLSFYNDVYWYVFVSIFSGLSSPFGAVNIRFCEWFIVENWIYLIFRVGRVNEKFPGAFKNNCGVGKINKISIISNNVDKIDFVFFVI